MERPSTLGELRASGYRPRSVKEELRRNLIRKLREGEVLFPGLLGYDDTVIPELCNAILARHDLLLLGLRGQGKSRLLRQLVGLLDEAIPAVAGSEWRDDPFNPVSAYARNRLAREGDDTPVVWVLREERYQEKLATPDVNMADLFGDIDLMKYAGGLALADEATLHPGLLPRANRGLFCINELPDLAPKIQVGLFNLLQERDVQIRGYPVRFRLDLCLLFSANPEDYTSRGRIVTPLKDRLGSVIRTHYPPTREVGIAIVDSNAWIDRGALPVFLPGFMKELVEELARRARSSPAVNQRSGVSVRLSIAACELLVSSAERRALLQGEAAAVPRPSDLTAMLAGTRGRLEPALDQEEGDEDQLVDALLGQAVKEVFSQHADLAGFNGVINWFQSGRSFLVRGNAPAQHVVAQAEEVPGLLQQAHRLAAPFTPSNVSDALRTGVLAACVEWALEGLYRLGRLSRRHEGGAERFGR